jgi:hypothetical protein
MSDFLDLRDLAEEYARLEERAGDADNPLDEDEQARLNALKDLQGQLFNEDLQEYGDNEPTLIPEDGFEDYCRDFAYDVGYIEGNDDNPLHSFIDWEAWADSLRDDYQEVCFEGEVYLLRAY